MLFKKVVSLIMAMTIVSSVCCICEASALPDANKYTSLSTNVKGHQSNTDDGGRWQRDMNGMTVKAEL